MSEQILYTDDEAAQVKTVTGWFSRTGQYWADNEHQARWGGCTHMVCECGNIHEKGWTKCEPCRQDSRRERYKEKPFKEWDGTTMLYSDSYDEYFIDEEEIIVFCEDNECESSDLDLIVCEPQYPDTISGDCWQDIIPDDSDLESAAPDELLALLDKVNQYILKEKPVFSWYPGEYRTTFNTSATAQNSSCEG